MTVIVPGWWRGQIVRGRVACSQGSQVVSVVPGVSVSLISLPVVLKTQTNIIKSWQNTGLILPWEVEAGPACPRDIWGISTSQPRDLHRTAVASVLAPHQPRVLPGPGLAPPGPGLR